MGASSGAVSGHKPTISVIIPCYNDADNLGRCLDSVFAQTEPAFEIIVVDDASSDVSPRLLRSCCASHTNLVLISHSENRGPAHARASGVRAARGSHLLFLDADDSLRVDSIALLGAELERDEADILHFAMNVIPTGDVSSEMAKGFEKWATPGLERISGGDILASCFVARRYNWNLCGKLIAMPVARRAFASLSDEHFLRSEDLYAYVLVAFFAATYRAIGAERLYNYYFGSGGDGNTTVSLQRYASAWLKSPRLAALIREFLVSQGAFKARRHVYECVRQILIDDCVEFYIVRIVDADKPAAYRALCDAWGRAVIDRELLFRAQPLPGRRHSLLSRFFWLLGGLRTRLRALLDAPLGTVKQ
jgi:glycosyltransferase involved in cell wall biosynthesis